MSEPSPKPPAYDWQWHALPSDSPETLAKCAEMLEAARDFIADIREGHPPRWLVLLGDPGCGKTHLATRLRDWLRRYGQWCYDRNVYPDVQDDRKLSRIFTYAQEGPEMVKWGTLLEKLRDGSRWDFSRACGDQYKVIDDVGVDSFTKNARGELEATPFAVQKMGELLDRRLEKWTVITANFSIEQFHTIFDSRIASRLLRNSVVVNAFGLRDYKLEELKIRKR